MGDAGRAADLSRVPGVEPARLRRAPGVPRARGALAGSCCEGAGEPASAPIAHWENARVVSASTTTCRDADRDGTKFAWDGVCWGMHPRFNCSLQCCCTELN